MGEIDYGMEKKHVSSVEKDCANRSAAERQQRKTEQNPGLKTAGSGLGKGTGRF